MLSPTEAIFRCSQTRTAVSEPVVRSLYRRLQQDDGPGAAHSTVDNSFEAWRTTSLPNFRSLGTSQRAQLIDRLASAWRKQFPWFQGDDLASIEALIFAVQTFATIVIRRYLLARLQAASADRVSPPNSRDTSTIEFDATWQDAVFTRFGWRGFEMPVFEWWIDAFDDPREVDSLARYLKQLDASLSAAILPADSSRPETRVAKPEVDWFRTLIEDLFPPVIRKALGEFYTPNWLVRRTLDNVGYAGDPYQRVLDPTCGSGAFVCEALARRQRRIDPTRLAGDGTTTIQDIDWPVVGIDLNPLAVFAARANYVLAVADALALNTIPQQVPIFHADAILSSFSPKLDDRMDHHEVHRQLEPRTALPADLAEAFDFVVGNPPWVSWESLTPQYRRETESLWHRYRLFTAQGMQTILGHGKKDLSMLISYAVTDRFLKPSGRLAFVVTNGLFRNHGAGQGFRRFQLSSATHDQLAVEQVDDFSDVEPFPNISTSSCVFTWRKGEPTSYPVPYRRWSVAGQNGKSRAAHLEQLASHQWRCKDEQAVPSVTHESHSSWLIGTPEELEAWRSLLRPSRYRAYEGVNTGGANGIYWLHLIERISETLVRVRNMPECGKKALPSVEATLETRFLYPLVRGVQMRRWEATTDTWVLLVQDPVRRQGIKASQLRSLAPRTWDYLQQFEQQLTQRAAYQRFFQKARKPSNSESPDAPFYSMFNVGSYTMSPFKVAWHRMKAPVEAAILEPIGEKPLLPQETHAFIPVDSREHAVYVAALLNSRFFNRIAEATSQPGGKSFGSPHLLERIHVPSFNPKLPSHQRLIEAGLAFAPSAAIAMAAELERAAIDVFREAATAFEANSQEFPPARPKTVSPGNIGDAPPNPL